MNRITVFEYSIFGDSTGQTKIGNFTTEKLFNSTYNGVRKPKDLYICSSYTLVRETKSLSGGK